MNFKNLLKRASVAVAVCAVAFAPAYAAHKVATSNSLSKAFKVKAMANSVKPLAVADDETVFTYAPEGTTNYYRTGEAVEDYNLAVFVDGKTLTGAKVVGLRVNFIQRNNITDASGWISTELSAQNNEIVVTGERVEFTPAAGWNEIRFENPVDVPSEGLYVGYSFTLTANGNNDFPIGVGNSIPDAGCCFGYMPSWCSETGEWADLSSDNIKMEALSMEVILSDVTPIGASVELDDYIITKPGETSTCNVTVTNYTDEEVSSVEYTYSVAGQAGSGSASLQISSIWSDSDAFSLDLPSINETGEYELTVTVTKVNGKENTNADASATTSVVVSDVEIKHRAVLEEYTGTWCGYCPRGFVAMNRMAEMYPDDFIGLAYHGSDIMEASNVVFPTSVSGYPAGVLDRVSGQIDPYHGSASGYEMGIEQDWLDRCSVPTPAAIEVEAALSEDGETVEVTSHTTFVVSTSGEYTIGYALLADGLTGTGSYWAQSNYFSGAGAYYPGEDFEVFTNGGSSVSGLEFNDVVIIAPEITGVAESLPSEINSNEEYTHNYTFTLSEATSRYYRVSLVQDVNKLRVVAVLLNADGEIVNANKAKVAVESSSVNDIEESVEEPVEVARYSLDGRLLAEPERGVNIVKMSDGTAHKEIVK